MPGPTQLAERQIPGPLNRKHKTGEAHHTHASYRLVTRGPCDLIMPIEAKGLCTLPKVRCRFIVMSPNWPTATRARQWIVAAFRLSGSVGYIQPRCIRPEGDDETLQPGQ